MSFSLQERYAIAVLLAAQLLYSAASVGQEIVKTKLGSIRGSVLTSDKGFEFLAFRGIPYAKPPIKSLRFAFSSAITARLAFAQGESINRRYSMKNLTKGAFFPDTTTEIQPPQLYDQKYDGVLDATEDGNVCIQYSHFAKTFSGDEDCLYLNVYAPMQDMTDELHPVLHPVMFWIHGGSFTSGSGSFDEFGPHKLIEKDVVLVTINYRLGPFGFLSTLDEAAPGNYGLLDQVMALKWVQDNIRPFGGDPNKVTIFGASAGSMSVGFHLISPLSKGLFHAAIAQSGSALVENFVSQDESTSLHFAQDVGKRLNCPTDCNKKMMKCLRKRPALDLIIRSATTSDNYVSTTADYLAFKPVVDTAYGQDSFLPDFPEKLLAKKQFNAVPLMTGANKDEGILMLVAIRGIGGFLGFNKTHVPIVLKWLAPSLYSGEDAGQKASQMVTEKYFGDVDESDLKQKLIALNKFLADVYFTYTMDVLNDYFVEYNVPTYVYKFTYKGKQHSFVDLLPPTPLFSEDMQIVAHGDELQYLFRNELFKWAVPPPEEDGKMSEIMLTLWTNFAKEKVPRMTGSAQNHPSFKWEPLSSESRHYLELNTSPHMVNGYLSYGYETFKDAHHVANFYKEEL